MYGRYGISPDFGLR